MKVDKGKKPKIEERNEDDDDYFDEIDREILLSIQKLEDLQGELEKVNEEECKEVLDIEHKYGEISRPVYAKRKQVIEAIPDFWSTAFLSHPHLYDFLRMEDQDVFKYLSSLEVEDFKDGDGKSGYSITFNFKPNPYFEDTKLSKTFSFPEDEITKVTGTTIKWKEGMDITNGVDHEKKERKRSYVADERRSFFCWFSETKPDDILEVFDGVDTLDAPFLQVTELIKEDLWPNPLKFYNYETDEEKDDDNSQKKEDSDEEEDDDDNES